MVCFPRSPDLSIRYAAVSINYMRSMFEIAENPMFTNPLWGVTANIMVRLELRFDTD
jgi:hypothetical protein